MIEEKEKPETLKSHSQMSDAIQNILAILGDVFETYHGYAYVFDDEKLSLQIQVGSGFYRELLGVRIRPGEGLAGRVWNSRQPLIVRNYLKWPGRIRGPEFEKMNATWGVPFDLTCGVGGVLGFSYPRDCEEFRRINREVLHFLSKLISPMMNNPMPLRQELKQGLKRNDKLTELTRNLENELQIKTSELAKTKAAIEVLLRMREEDRTTLERRVLLNIRQFLEPSIEKLDKSCLNETQKNYLQVLRSNLNEIASEFLTLTPISFLNPSELAVANLVRHGKTSKEIADLMGLSIETVKTHKKHVRKKLGINSTKLNLRTFLLTGKTGEYRQRSSM
jgi:DNA-binding CsgD family transcriptional regulator